MDTARTLLGDPTVRDDAVASALGTLVAGAALAAVFGHALPTAALAVGALALLVFAAGAAYRGGGYPAALALALLPVVGWLVGPLPAGGTVAPRAALTALGAGVVVGTVGFALGVVARALRS
ncbi:MAG: hypothetical protein ABEJ23_10400 [Haloarculaceae archaeon]